MKKLIAVLLIIIFACMYAIAYGAEDDFKIVEFESKYSDVTGVYRDYPAHNWANYLAYKNNLLNKKDFRAQDPDDLLIQVYYLKNHDAYMVKFSEYVSLTYDEWKEFKAELKYSFTLGSGRKSKTKVYYHKSKLVVENTLIYSGAFLYPIAKSYYDKGDRRLLFNMHINGVDDKSKIDLKGIQLQIEPEMFVKMRENEKEHWKTKPKVKSSK